MMSSKAPALKLRGEAEFEHEGETLKIALDVVVMMAAEAETGIGLLRMANGLGNMMVVSSILRFGLSKGCGKEVTIGQAAEMLLTNAAVHPAVEAAFQGFLPEPTKGAGAGDRGTENPPQDGAGTNC